MAQDWAKSFYKSPAWAKNRKNYLNAVIDTSGNVLVATKRNGKLIYIRRDDGTPVPDALVVPPGMCERCFQMGELTPAKVAHHINHITPQNIDDPSVTLSYANLQRLCQDCHAYVHSGQNEPRVVFDENGNAAPRHDSFEAQVMRLTETVDDKRNIHKETHGHMR